jgi:hypothetical protein
LKEKLSKFCVGFGVLIAVSALGFSFWDITPCNQVKNNAFSCFLIHEGSLLGLFFEPEDGGDMFFRKFGWIL